MTSTDSIIKKNGVNVHYENANEMTIMRPKVKRSVSNINTEKTHFQRRFTFDVVAECINSDRMRTMIVDGRRSFRCSHHQITKMEYKKRNGRRCNWQNYQKLLWRVCHFCVFVTNDTMRCVDASVSVCWMTCNHPAISSRSFSISNRRLQKCSRASMSPTLCVWSAMLDIFSRFGPSTEWRVLWLDDTLLNFENEWNEWLKNFPLWKCKPKTSAFTCFQWKSISHWACRVCVPRISIFLSAAINCSIKMLSLVFRLVFFLFRYRFAASSNELKIAWSPGRRKTIEFSANNAKLWLPENQWVQVGVFSIAFSWNEIEESLIAKIVPRFFSESRC